MNQVVEARSRADTVSVVSVTSSEPGDESGLLTGLWRRVRDAVHSPANSTGNLQEVLNEVSGQAQDEPVPSEAPSSSGTDVEKCGVCERSFRHRGPKVTCSGCGKNAHKNYCVRYTKMSENYRAGMCNICCNKVEDMILDVREYTESQGLNWRQETWLKKLVKSHSRGFGLEYQSFRVFNKLQKFIWQALGRGLVIRENYVPFDPVFFSSTNSTGSTPLRPAGQPQPSPPWQDSRRSSTAQDARTSEGPRDEHGTNGDRQSHREPSVSPQGSD